MNDFTKEELMDLHYSLYGGVHDDHPVPDHLIILQKKIQSMIDNYCEHPINNVCMECFSATCEICNKIYGLKDE